MAPLRLSSHENILLSGSISCNLRKPSSFAYSSTKWQWATPFQAVVSIASPGDLLSICIVSMYEFGWPPIHQIWFWKTPWGVWTIYQIGRCCWGCLAALREFNYLADFQPSRGFDIVMFSNQKTLYLTQQLWFKFPLWLFQDFYLASEYLFCAGLRSLLLPEGSQKKSLLCFLIFGFEALRVSPWAW